MEWWVSTSVPDSESRSLDDKEASILATANQHMFVSSLKKKSIEKVKTDGYYTHQTMNDTIEMVFDKQNVPMCTQLTRLKTINYRKLIQLPQEVNDDTESLW